ncbi:hypothetical protein GCM10023068_35430 [Leifsonia shinshuensis]
MGELLDRADPADHEPAHPLRGQADERERHPAAHRVPDDIDALEALLVEHREQVARQEVGRVGGRVVRRVAGPVAAQVGDDRPAPRLGERGDPAGGLPGERARRGEAVDQQDGVGPGVAFDVDANGPILADGGPDQAPAVSRARSRSASASAVSATSAK